MGYLVEMMMQMQHSLGELKSDVSHLKTASERHGEKLGRIEKILFASGVVLALLLSVGGFFLNKIWDGILVLLKTSH